MKKQYQRPVLVCEELRPETMLCGCAIQNQNLNEQYECAYFPEGLGFALFLDSWDSCMIKDSYGGTYCVYSGQVNVFGS